MGDNWYRLYVIDKSGKYATVTNALNLVAKSDDEIIANVADGQWQDATSSLILAALDNQSIDSTVEAAIYETA